MSVSHHWGYRILKHSRRYWPVGKIGTDPHIETMRAVWPGRTVRRTAAEGPSDREPPLSPESTQRGIDASVEPEESPAHTCGARKRNVEGHGRAPQGFKS